MSTTFGEDAIVFQKNFKTFSLEFHFISNVHNNIEELDKTSPAEGRKNFGGGAIVRKSAKAVSQQANECISNMHNEKHAAHVRKN